MGKWGTNLKVYLTGAFMSAILLCLLVMGLVAVYAIARGAWIMLLRLLE